MKALDWFKASALLALAAWLVSLTAATLQVRDEVRATAAALRSELVSAQAVTDGLGRVAPKAVETLGRVESTADKVGSQAVRTLQVAEKAGPVLDGVTRTLDAVNRPCVPNGPPCGTLADVNRTLATARGTMGQVEVGARHFNQNLSTLDVQERTLFTDFHATTTSLNDLVGSPDVKRFLRSSADTSTEVAAIAKDVHREADRITAPQPWYKKLYTYGNTGVNIACLATHSCPF